MKKHRNEKRTAARVVLLLDGSKRGAIQGREELRILSGMMGNASSGVTKRRRPDLVQCDEESHIGNERGKNEQLGK